MNRPPMEWEKILKNQRSDKELIKIILKTHMNQQGEKTSVWLKHEQRIWTHFSGEDIQIANRYMKKSSTSLITREMQNKEQDTEAT